MHNKYRTWPNTDQLLLANQEFKCQPILNRLHSLWRHQGFFKWEKKKQKTIHQKNLLYWEEGVIYILKCDTKVLTLACPAHEASQKFYWIFVIHVRPTLDVFLPFSLLRSCFLENSPTHHKANLARQCTVWVLQMQDNNCANVNCKLATIAGTKLAWE